MRSRSSTETRGAGSLDPFRVGKYEVLSSIGSGGMACVYRARMEAPGGAQKEVALKLVRPHLADREFVLMFLDEMRMAMAMSHRNIVQTFDAGRAEGRFYLVMELVKGCSLSRLLSLFHPRPLPIEIALFIGMEVAAALDYAHRFRPAGSTHTAGLVHRDVSPSNILLSREGDVKLADFGVAKAAGRLTVTSVNLVKGKLEYMSPEQALGEEEPRSDLFSLGAILYEMTTGQPFRRGHDLEAILRGPTRLVPPSEHARGIPGSLERLILCCLSPALEDRPRSAEELRAALSEESFRLQYQMGIGHDLHARLQSFLAAHLNSETGMDAGAAKAAQAMLEQAPLELDPGFTLSDLLLRAEDPRELLLSGELEVSSVTTESAPGRRVPPDEEKTTALRVRAAPALARTLEPAPHPLGRGQARAPSADAAPHEPAADAAPREPASDAGEPATPPREPAAPPREPAAAPRREPAIVPRELAASIVTPPPSPMTIQHARALGWIAPRGRVALVVAALLLLVALGSVALWQSASSPPPARVAGKADLRPPADLGLPAVDRHADDAPRRAVTPDAARDWQRPDTARPRPAILRRPGFLEINAIPWAVVFIDGRRLGETPLQGVALPPGQHRVRLESPTRKVTRTITVQIRSGQTTRRLVTLAP